MGIKGFYTWLKQNYPLALKTYLKNRIYDYIYVDVNHILHNSINECKNEVQFITSLFKHLDYIFNVYIATKKVVLAIDGPSPYSKILLQQKRRAEFVKKPNIELNKLNSLYLTPGTSLMNKISFLLLEYTNKLKKKYKFVNTEFIVSSTLNPDEGEIKLFREMIKNYNKNEFASHLVIGNDADLVILAMAVNPIINIDILIKHVNEFNVISIKRLIKQHAKKIIDIKYLNIDENVYFNPINFENSFIRIDFCIISIMIGNDYISKLKYLPTDTNDKFDLLWKSYKKTFTALDKPLIINGKFNYIFLKKFMFHLMLNIAPQFNKFKLTEFNESLVENYLEGLLWCLNMYQTSYCPKYDYIYRYKSGPSPVDIYYYLELCSKDINIPVSNTPPLTCEACVILLIPKKAKHLIPKKYLKLVNGKIKNKSNSKSNSKSVINDDEFYFEIGDIKKVIECTTK